MNEINAVGRRKTAVARVFMFTGKSDNILVNKKSIDDYFGKRQELVNEALSPFKLLGIDKTSLVKINVRGGGKSGQAGAIRLGISRILAKLDEQSRKILRANGYLTRDARMVERKKVGRHKARKSIQYSKR
ncbi:MAG: 30S ribosomal protein S9 [Elusimicrobiota bacterium]